MGRSRRAASVALPAILTGVLVLGQVPSARAQAQEEGATKQRLDRVLAVLRERSQEARQPCLKAMTDVHGTEDQVAELSKTETDPSGSEGEDRPHASLDIARDVLGSDYEAAAAACLPDAQRACQDGAGDPKIARSCAALSAPVSGGPDGAPPPDSPPPQ